MKVWGVSGYSPWWGTQLAPDILDREDSGGIAGGETMMLEQCFALAAVGNDVTLFSNVFRKGEYQGVKFRDQTDYVRALLIDNDPDVVLAWKNPEALSDAPESAARILVQQCNDLDYSPGWTDFTDALVAASANHGELLRSFGFKGPIEVVHNGCYVERYPRPGTPPQKREPIVGYWSSPDRGLHHLLRAWPRVRELRPDAKLRVHYEIERIFKLADEMESGHAGHHSLMRVKALRKAIEGARRLPGVTFTGMMPRNALIRAQCETRVMAYPLDPIAYTEGMGGSVSEAMAAGCLPLIRPVDAFPSVYSGAVRWIEGNPIAADFSDSFATQIVQALEWEGVAQGPTLEQLYARADRWSWANARVETIAMVERVCARKAGAAVREPAFPLEDPRWGGA
jgi:glycosyltransferase involved in cell wall biosynthesis